MDEVRRLALQTAVEIMRGHSHLHGTDVSYVLEAAREIENYLYGREMPTLTEAGKQLLARAQAQ